MSMPLIVPKMMATKKPVPNPTRRSLSSVAANPPMPNSPSATNTARTANHGAFIQVGQCSYDRRRRGMMSANSRSTPQSATPTTITTRDWASVTAAG